MSETENGRTTVSYQLEDSSLGQEHHSVDMCYPNAEIVLKKQLTSMHVLLLQAIYKAVNKICLRQAFQCMLDYSEVPQVRKLQIHCKVKNSVLEEVSSVKNAQLIQLVGANARVGSVDRRTMMRKMFQIEQDYQYLRKKVNSLQSALQDTTRRHEKQMARKREGLEMLVQQIREKNEAIEQLKASQRQLRLKRMKGNVYDTVLQQDPESLKRTVFRLENVNERLNLSLVNRSNEIQQLQKKLNETQTSLLQLREENTRLRTLNFQMARSECVYLDKVKQCDYLARKAVAKIDRATRLQKKCNQLFRGGFQQQKPTQSGNTTGLMSTTGSDSDDKLQRIFEFIFHLDEEDYKLKKELFDQDQQQLLLSHKEKYLAIVVTERKWLEEVERNPIKSKGEIIECGNKFEDQSLFQMLVGRKPVDVQDQSAKLQTLTQQKKQQIERISELKDKHMHIRNIVLNLLKALELRNLKKQAQDILTILLDIFQYSQGQKHMIFPPRQPKKLFGFI